MNWLCIDQVRNFVVNDLYGSRRRWLNPVRTSHIFELQNILTTASMQRSYDDEHIKSAADQS